MPIYKLDSGIAEIGPGVRFVPAVREANRPSERSIGLRSRVRVRKRRTFNRETEVVGYRSVRPPLETVHRARCWSILLLIGIQWSLEHRCNFLPLTIFARPSPPHASRILGPRSPRSPRSVSFSLRTLIRISHCPLPRCRSLYFTSIFLGTRVSPRNPRRSSLLLSPSRSLSSAGLLLLLFPFHEASSRAKSMYV